MILNSRNMPKCPKCGTTRYRTAKSFRSHVSRWCQLTAPLEVAASSISTSSTTSSETTATQHSVTTTASTQLGKRRRDEDEIEENPDVVDTEELPFNIFPQEESLQVRPTCNSPAPIPERPVGMKESDYVWRVKYLELTNIIHENISTAQLSETARHELFLMKFCMENGLGRDQGQQLLNWMKGVRVYEYYMNIT